MLRVVTGRASRIARLIGPLPTGITPRFAYSRESRPAEERQDRLGVPAEGVGARDAREALHRPVPRDDAEPRVSDEQGVLDALDDAQTELVHAGFAGARPHLREYITPVCHNEWRPNARKEPRCA